MSFLVFIQVTQKGFFFYYYFLVSEHSFDLYNVSKLKKHSKNTFIACLDEVDFMPNFLENQF
jgi:hypothetical protein